MGHATPSEIIEPVACRSKRERTKKCLVSACTSRRQQQAFIKHSQELVSQQSKDHTTASLQSWSRYKAGLTTMKNILPPNRLWCENCHAENKKQAILILLLSARQMYTLTEEQIWWCHPHEESSQLPPPPRSESGAWQGMTQWCPTQPYRPAHQFPCLCDREAQSGRDRDKLRVKLLACDARDMWREWQLTIYLSIGSRCTHWHRHPKGKKKKLKTKNIGNHCCHSKNQKPTRGSASGRLLLQRQQSDHQSGQEFGKLQNQLHRPDQKKIRPKLHEMNWNVRESRQDLLSPHVFLPSVCAALRELTSSALSYPALSAMIVGN